MNSHQWIGSASLLCLLLIFGSSANVAGQTSGLNDQGKEGNPKKAAAKPADKGRLLIWHSTKFVFVTPEGKQVGELPGHPEERVILNEPVLSPDGKQIACTAYGALADNENPITDEQGNLRRHVVICDLNRKDRWSKININASKVFWTPDGKNLVAVELLPGKEIKDRGVAVWWVDVNAKEKTQLDLPRWTVPSGMTPDGKSFVAALFDIDARTIHLALISRDGKNVSKLTEVRTEGLSADEPLQPEHVAFLIRRPDVKVSPDGNKLLFQDYDSTDKPEKDMPRLTRLFIYDLRFKKRARLEEIPLNAWINGYCWSPDGKQIACTWKQVQPGVPLAFSTNNLNDPKLHTETESHLMIADADGKNARTVLSEKAPSGPTVTIQYVDWR